MQKGATIMHNYDEHHNHSHTHADGCVHSHIHEHEHGHEHDHNHVHTGAQDEKKEVRALLNYMLDHNEHHAEELIAISDRLRELDMAAAAETLDAGISHYKKGNKLLEQALLSIAD